MAATTRRPSRTICRRSAFRSAFPSTMASLFEPDEQARISEPQSSEIGAAHRPTHVKEKDDAPIKARVHSSTGIPGGEAGRCPLFGADAATEDHRGHLHNRRRDPEPIAVPGAVGAVVVELARSDT